MLSNYIRLATHIYVYGRKCITVGIHIVTSDTLTVNIIVYIPKYVLYFRER